MSAKIAPCLSTLAACTHGEALPRPSSCFRDHEPLALSPIAVTPLVTFLPIYRRGERRDRQTGYVREIQMRRMVQLVRQPHVRHYCEIGMNGGHSVTAMLLANPRVVAHVFDIMKLKYSWPVADLLSINFRERFELHAGPSQETLPAWLDAFERNGSSCDLILIDGDHSEDGARKDLRTMRRAASPRTLFVYDDINMPPGRALLHEVKAGLVQVIELYGPFPRRSSFSPCMRVPAGDPRGDSPQMCPKWGYTVARWINNTAPPQPAPRAASNAVASSIKPPSWAAALKTHGGCETPITGKRACERAAGMLEMPIHRAVVVANASSPPYCYIDRASSSSLMFNAGGSNSGNCSETLRCLCLAYR